MFDIICGWYAVSITIEHVLIRCSRNVCSLFGSGSTRKTRQHVQIDGICDWALAARIRNLQVMEYFGCDFSIS